ncbi:MAG TPA: CYTH domain-containing protein [Abditibacteriaceae bacterium]|nr:CYTH domain-containing protein [Abditibacteriaceae bacterium]
MEIESKYTVSGPLDPDTLPLLDLSPYHLRPLKDAHHHDVHLDTPGHKISGASCGVRIRREEGTTKLTFKSLGQYSEGVHEREELEEELPPGAEFDVQRWPPSIAGRVREIVGDEPIVPLFEIKIRRRTWAVERAARVIGELAFDEGNIIAGERTEPLCEIEVEIKENGSRADLAELGRHLLDLLPLHPESRTKRHRGLALLAASADQW